MPYQTQLSKLFDSHKGILGLDEGLDRLKDRFLAARFTLSPKAQRQYLELMIKTAGLQDCISGVTLTDQSARLLTSDLELFVQLVKSQRYILGIRADLGYERSSLFNRQVVTRGLVGLEERMKEYSTWGTGYVIWRNKYYITATTPTQTIIELNNQEAIEFVISALKHKIIPIVQIKISTNGTQTMEATYKVMKIILEDLFSRMEVVGIEAKDVILQTNFVTPGRHNTESVLPKEIARMTYKLFSQSLPKDLGGIAFVCDGIRPGFGRLYLEEFHILAESSKYPVRATFSFGRGLHDGAMQNWGGKAERTSEAQVSLLQNARLDWISNQ